MNKENILILADHIERGAIRDLDHKKVHFNMLYWRESNSPNYKGRGCGTVACIGGSAEFLFNKSKNSWADAYHALGLDDSKGLSLFYPHEAVPDDNWNRITPAAAVEVLRHLAKTGKVNWKRAIKLHPLMPAKKKKAA